ncbi:MAG: bifunctional diaminohydroxyphosphoribosylaminopyrimidine deaminase/5-amino-6-(5-phosphoribosylamino)uracil reductase RibD [Flavobacteriales bacterium]|nr:bifunctional diaminohydroxyphosphoribosylaminopyrimidine deaminase/5-amino-6-(5-phosphoribosylamino)uracil reductase RibD [Flavobacteriales bacterium]
MNKHEHYMQRALELAQSGLGLVEPNPMVGCVIVCDDKIIGEGFHHEFGGPHAEVVAIRSVKNQELLQRSTLYVTLEPCSHHGKTPPCSDLIIEKGIPHVVIANSDPFEKVNGSGIEKLRAAGIEVEVGVLAQEGKKLNKRFFTFHQKKRPYIILKWAQSADGYIDKTRDEKNNRATKISGQQSQVLVHQWRTQEQAILVGKNTALLDNPYLTARLYSGRQPKRFVFDPHLELSSNLHVFGEEAATYILNYQKKDDLNHLYYRVIEKDNVLESLMNIFYEEQILSVLIEGGTYTLQHFIDAGLWDEARVFTSPLFIGEGIKSPQLSRTANEHYSIGEDHLTIIYNV